MAKKTSKKETKKVKKETNDSISRKELIEEVSFELDLNSSEAKKTVITILDIIQENLLEGKDVNIVGFGNFKVIAKDACIRRNPKTGENVNVKAKHILKFKPSSVLKDAIANI